MDLLTVIYDLGMALSILAGFVLFLITFSITFDGGAVLFLKLKISRIREIVKDKPKRSALTLASFLIFFAMSASYFFTPPNLDGNFVARSFIIRFPLVATELLLMWIVIQLEKEDGKLAPEEIDIKGVGE